MDPDTRKSLLELLSSRDEEKRREAMAALKGEISEDDLDWLLAPLSDESWRVRKEAIESLAQLTPTPGLIDRIIPLMEPSRELTLRNSIVEVLEKMGREGASLLLQHLDAEQPDVRKFLVDILGNLAEPSTVPALIEMLNDPMDNIRAAAAESLAAIGDVSATQALLDAVEDADEWVVFSILGALARLGDQRALPVFFKYLSSSIMAKPAITGIGIIGTVDDGVKLLKMIPDLSRGAAKAAFVAAGLIYRTQAQAKASDEAESLKIAIREMADEGILDFLTEQLSVTDELDEKQSYLSALGLIGGPRALESVLSHLDDDNLGWDVDLALYNMGLEHIHLIDGLFSHHDPLTRARAVKIFGYLEESADLEKIIPMLEDDSGHVRKAAINVLSFLGGADYIEHITALLSDEYRDVAHAAAQAIVNLGRNAPGDVESVVISLYHEAESSLKSILLQIICEIGITGYQKMSITAVQDEDPVMRAAAISCLRNNPSSESIKTIINSLTDESPEVRVQAAMALEELQPPEAMQPLKSALYDQDPWVRSAAVQAISNQPGLDPTILAEFLHGDDIMIVTSVIDALGLMAGRGAEEALVIMGDAFDESPMEIRRAICRVLGNIEGKGAYELLVKATGDDEPSIRTFAVHALAEREEPGITDLLESLAEDDPVKAVRDTARSILGARG